MNGNGNGKHANGSGAQSARDKGAAKPSTSTKPELPSFSWTKQWLPVVSATPRYRNLCAPLLPHASLLPAACLPRGQPPHMLHAPALAHMPLQLLHLARAIADMPELTPA
jgi:hypothetical protein